MPRPLPSAVALSVTSAWAVDRTTRARAVVSKLRVMSVLRQGMAKILYPPPVHDELRLDVRDAPRAGLPHGGHKLRSQDVEHPLDALLSEGGEPPDIGPPDTDRIGAERERLEGVGAAADAAVHEHGDAAVHGRRHLGKAVDRRAAAVLGATAMVRYDDPVDA